MNFWILSFRLIKIWLICKAILTLNVLLINQLSVDHTVLAMIKPCHGSTSHQDNVIKCKHLRYWPFVRGIHRSSVDDSVKHTGKVYIRIDTTLVRNYHTIQQMISWLLFKLFYWFWRRLYCVQPYAIQSPFIFRAVLIRLLSRPGFYRKGWAPNMMASSNGNIFRVTGPLCGEFTGPGEFPAQRPVTRGFDVFFDLHLNKRLSKQPRGWLFETPSWSLWSQCNETNVFQ